MALYKFALKFSYKSFVILMIYNVGLLWVSLGEILRRFWNKSFVIDMIPHGGLLWVSLGEIIMKFF